ncbi:hypothetical protein [Eubacterium coprostanoligenes]|uniref:hypothetical protein n=1 Tax=Eubacterium coprostanoligenes TaxID=290054 RepID=UPI002352415B|nr:hypothetical protein [Eubacterium coprostanoligenes]MCI6354011.1 hypothetical protein [Eubacterium coprostanoligenes]
MDIKAEKIRKILLLFIVIAVPTAIFLIRDLDNDTWFMLNHGRYILENGLYPEFEPFTVHEGLHFTFQKWLCCVLFWVIYKYCGKFALKLFCLIVYFAFNLVMYKLLEYIRPKANIQHLFTLAVMNIFMIQFMYTRPQLFTYLFLAIEILVLEKYVKENNVKLLAVIPLLSFLEIQIHSTIWPILLIYMLPYMFDFSSLAKVCEKVKLLSQTHYKKLPIWIAFFASMLVALINPYGFESIVYLVKSLDIEELAILISEVRSPRFLSSNVLFIVITIVFCLYGLYKTKLTELRYVYFIGGTVLMAIMSTRQFSFLVIPAVMVFSYYFDLKELKSFTKNVMIIILCAFAVVPIYSAYEMQVNVQQYKIDVGDFLADYDGNPDGVKVFNVGDEGSYLEFLGFKAYNDTRAEVFSDKINNKENSLKKVILFEMEKAPYTEYIYKYDYKYIVVYNFYKKQCSAMNKDENLKKIYTNRLYNVYEIKNTK